MTPSNWLRLVVNSVVGMTPECLIGVIRRCDDPSAGSSGTETSFRALY